MEQLIIASGNSGKIKEIKEILADLPLNVVSMKELGIDIKFEEIGATFSENALIKAKTLSGVVDGIVMADDSGLEIDFLNGALEFLQPVSPEKILARKKRTLK